MVDIPRISPQQARDKVRSGRALLACAYDDEAKCSKMKLEGAIMLSDLRQRLPFLPKNQEIIFYCT